MNKYVKVDDKYAILKEKNSSYRIANINDLEREYVTLTNTPNGWKFTKIIKEGVPIYGYTDFYETPTEALRILGGSIVDKLVSAINRLSTRSTISRKRSNIVNTSSDTFRNPIFPRRNSRKRQKKGQFRNKRRFSKKTARKNGPKRKKARSRKKSN